MVFFFVVSILGVGLFSPNPFGVEYLNAEKHNISASYNKRWNKLQKEAMTGIEYSPPAQYSDYKITPRIGVYQSEFGSTFVSLGFKKDIVITPRIVFTGQAMPTLAFIENQDKEFSSGKLNFNMSFSVSYLVTKQFSVGLGMLHISNANTKQPNYGFDTVNLKVNFYL